MQSNFKDIISVNKPVLIDFHADWCGPCQTMAPILKEVKDHMGDRIHIIKINVDQNKELAARFQIRGVPTFMIFKNGSHLWQQSGLLSKKDLIDLLNSYA